MYEIFSLSNSQELGLNISKKLDIPLSSLETEIFSDGEISVSFPNSIRGKHVYIVGSTSSNDNIIEMLLSIDAAKIAGAYKVHAVIPYYGYARQDKRGKLRSALGARVIAKSLETNGVDSVICADLHASQIQLAFSNTTSVIEIEGKDIFSPVLQHIVNADEWLICSPDAGGATRAKKMSRQLGLGMVLMDKTRDKPNSVGDMVLIGDVKNKKVIIVDDMVDTAGTLCKSAEILNNMGCAEVYACITHGILSGLAYERLKTSKIKKLYISDSIPIKKINSLGVEKPENIEVVSSSDVISMIIKASRENTSIESTFRKAYKYE